MAWEAVSVTLSLFYCGGDGRSAQEQHLAVGS